MGAILPLVLRGESLEMAIAVRVMLANGDEMVQPYLVRIGGWTEERYFREAPETRFVEFEDGEVIVHSPVSIRHQRVARFLTMLLQGYAQHRNLGEVLNGPAVVRLRPGLDYEPDIFFVPRDRLDRLEEQYFAAAPGLIVEVISEGTRSHDLKTKPAAYREHGVPEYWAVDPERKVLFQHLPPPEPQSPHAVREQTTGRLECPAVPGFWLDVSWLWQDPLPDALGCLSLILA
jgi:Uma2 family endonuclease